MRILSTLYVVEHRAKVSVQKRTLVVRLPDGEHLRVPIETVDTVVLLGQAQVTSQALTLCATKGIAVTSLSRNGKVRFTVRGQTRGNVLLRMAQLRAADNDGSSLELARWFVAGKLQNSLRLVKRWARDAKEPRRGGLDLRAEEIRRQLARLEDAETPDLVRGLEGDAGRAHFRAMAAVLAGGEITFANRNRRPPRDPINALLGFAYALLVGEATGACEAVGLDPQVGFLHRQRPGRPALALDLVEELRAPVADRLVVRAVRLRQIGPDDFQAAPGGATYLTDDGRRKFLRIYEEHREVEVFHAVLGRRIGRWALPHVQATLLARFLRGDLAAYPPYIMGEG